MSQSGKVLHLYVEVRSAPDQNGGKGGFVEKEEGLAQEKAVKDSPAELLSHLASQTTCKTSSKTSTPQRLAQDCTHTHGTSPSRNSVSFGSSPKASKRWSAPCDGVHSPKMLSPRKIPKSNCSRLKEGEVSDGKRSVVTFSYVEKSNVKTMESPRNSPCERRGTREDRSNPCYFRKRLSDPVWFSPDSSCSSSPKLTFRSPGSHQQTFSPGFRQPHFDPIGRAATQRAVEEFGSPLLRIKLAHALENLPTSRYNQQPRCQSWAGSPVQRQSVNPKENVAERSSAVCGFWSPVSKSRQSPLSKPESQSPVTKRLIHRTCNRSTSPQGAILQLGNNVIEGLNQLSDSKSSSPAHSPEVARRLAEEATKVSSIFTEARRSSLHNALGEPAGDAHTSATNAQTLKMNIPLNDQQTPATDNTDSHQLETSTAQSQTQETNSQNNFESNQLDCGNKPQQQQHSILSTPHGSPAIPSRVYRPSHPPTDLSSPLRDPRLRQAELRAPDTPTLHRRQPPQYMRETWSSSADRGDLSCFEKGDCTELARRLFINQSVEEAPVSWTSRQQWSEKTPNPESGSVSSQTSERRSSRRRRPLSPTAQQKRAEQRRREILLLGPVALDSPDEDEGCDEEGAGDEVDGFGEGEQRAEEPAEGEQNGGMGGSSSRSSSGVTGSLGDRDCVSPESSQSSHQSNETGAATSGIQVRPERPTGGAQRVLGLDN